MYDRADSPERSELFLLFKACNVLRINGKSQQHVPNMCRQTIARRAGQHGKSCLEISLTAWCLQ